VISATLSLLLEAIVASLYLYVGVLTWRRAEPSRSAALQAFAVFWLGLGMYGLSEATWGLAFIGGIGDLPFAIAVLHLKIAFAVAGFAGLVYYLLYIYTGRETLRPYVAGFYVLVAFVVEYFYAWRDPIGQRITTWGISLEYANPQGPLWNVVVVLLFVPPLLSALGYASLLRVIRSPLERFRIVAVSASLGTFFLALTFGWMTNYLPWWGLAEKVLSLAAILGVLASLKPPAWVRARFRDAAAP